jgi:hypothetical protein
MQKKNYSHDVLLSVTYAQAYLWVEPIFFRSGQSRYKTATDAPDIRFRLKLETTVANRRE